MGEQKISYSKLVGHFQHDLFIILDKWKVNFGTDLERTWNNTKTGNMSQPHHTPEPIKDLVETAKHRLNEASRVGEASLFLRDPREDRLVLFYSTSENLLKGNADSKQVRDRANYFDSSQGCYYYPLYDRLADAQDRESEHSKIARGLTGWVAVAGHYLIVNGEYGNQGLISLSEDRPETLGACQRYGIPIWGRHIAEAPSDPNRPKRFIAVPIQSCADTKKTIGVLRYACPCSGRELSESDLVFLQEISNLISATLGLQAAATRAIRGSEVALRKDHLRRTYNFGAFLDFLANSLRSNIASVYLDVGGIVDTESRLRLLDAHGIKAPVARLRATNQIQDYLQGEGGFTRWLYDSAPKEPTIVTSVHSHHSWRGKNTPVFYGDHFRKLLQESGAPAGQPTEIARQYEIKIIGMPLFYGDDRVGVLKVELPNSFDDSRHYDIEDQVFLKDCASTLGEVLGDFQLYLKCLWPTGDGRIHQIVNMTRMASEVLRTRVISPDEAPTYWEDLTQFLKNNQTEVAVEIVETLNRLQPPDKAIIKESPSWMEHFSKAVLTELLVKILMHSLT
jgi:hypothetical protein